jgi:hypothetical protein
MRPPNTDQKELHKWKNEVVDRVREIADDLFDFNSEDDIDDYINIDDPWADENWAEHDTGDAGFQDHDFEVSYYRLKPLKTKINYVSSNWPELPIVDFRESLTGDFMGSIGVDDLIAVDGPIYSYEDLPDAAKQLVDFDVGFSVDPKDPKQRFVLACCTTEGGIHVVSVTEVKPGVYQVKRDFESNERPYYTFVNEDRVVEMNEQWKGTDFVSFAGGKISKVEVKTATININDYQNNTVTQPAPVQQPVAADTPETPNLVDVPDKVPAVTAADPVQSPQESGPVSFAENGQQPEVRPEMVEVPVQPEVRPESSPEPVSLPFAEQGQQPVTPEVAVTPLPSTVDLIQKFDDLNLQQWQDTLAKKKPKPQEPITVAKALLTGVEKTVDLATPAVLIGVSVQFPLAGAVVSGVQGAVAGYTKARDAGADMYQSVWNGATGATTNVTVGLVAGKVGGAGLGKLKVTGNVTQKVLDVGNAVVGDKVSGAATNAATTFKPALVPLVAKFVVEGVPDSPSANPDFDPGTYGARGGLLMEREYYDR